MDFKINKHTILIAPYWNVKVLELTKTLLPFSILIAPYWNVKYRGVVHGIIIFIILIAPYWNVKWKSLWFFAKEKAF